MIIYETMTFPVGTLQHTMDPFEGKLKLKRGVKKITEGAKKRMKTENKELCSAWSWSQLGLVNDPKALLMPRSKSSSK